MATGAAGDDRAPPLVDPELLLLDRLAAEEEQQREHASTALTSGAPPIALASTNEPATAANLAGRPPPQPSTMAAASAAPAAAAAPSNAVASGSGSPPSLEVASSTSGSRKRKGPIKDSYVCTICSPPVAFPTSAKKAGHTQVVHQARVRVTSDAGLYFYVGRDDADRAFSCPRLGCSHRTPNTVSFGLHVRHTCRQLWPATAPDPPEADLPRNEQEEAEGNKRKRGGGRGKGKRRKGLAEGSDSTTTTTGELGPDTQPQAVVDRLRTLIDDVLIQGGTGEGPRTVHGLLRRLETQRQALLAQAEHTLGLGANRQATEALHQTRQALLDSPGGLLTRGFVRWHVYSLLSPSFVGVAQEALARLDLNSIASLVLSYLPFAAQGPNASDAALRSTLLMAVARIEQGQPALAPGSHPIPTIDQLRATLLYHADLIASADRALAPFAPPHPAPVARDGSPSLSAASVVSGLVAGGSTRRTRSTAAVTYPVQQSFAPIQTGPSHIPSYPPASHAASYTASLPFPPPPSSSSSSSSATLPPLPTVIDPTLPPPLAFPPLGGARPTGPLGPGLPGLPIQASTYPLPPVLAFPPTSAYDTGTGINNGGQTSSSSAPPQSSLLSHPSLTPASFDSAPPSTVAADARRLDSAPAPPGEQSSAQQGSTARPPLPSSAAAAAVALAGAGSAAGRSSRRQQQQAERERITQLYLLAEELAGASSP